MLLFAVLNDVTTSAPKSSHIVPNNATPAAFCLTGSLIPASPVITSSNASLAESPPFANFCAISSALSPISVNPLTVVPLQSIALIDNSFTASPILSRLKAPFSAPLTNIENISSASKPSFWNCTEYSLILSIISSEKSSPFCAPCAIKLKASSEVTPKFCMIVFTALTLSFTSMPNVSRIVIALSVTF